MKLNAFRVVFFLGMSFLIYQISQYIFGDWPMDDQIEQAWDYVKETFDDTDKAKNDIQSEIDKINPQSDLDRMQSEILEKYEAEKKSPYSGPWDLCFDKDIYEDGYLIGTPSISIRKLKDGKVEGYYRWIPPAEMGSWGGLFSGEYIAENLIKGKGNWSNEGLDYEVNFKIKINKNSAIVDHPEDWGETAFTLEAVKCETH